MAKRKQSSTKRTETKVCGNATWTINFGCLAKAPGRPAKVSSLFKAVAEKIPYEFILNVRKFIRSKNGSIGENGVYIAHDSMGYARYIGRGNVFNRLQARKKAQTLELSYFSFYIVEDKIHERELETIMIRAAGPQLHFNDKKRRVDITPGDVRDFEAGTFFIERQYKKGRRSADAH